MNYKEAQMNEPLQRWLRQKGYVPYVEVPDQFGMRCFDLVGLKDEDNVIIIEMKSCLNSGVFYQGNRALLTCKKVYCAVLSKPRAASLDKFKDKGLGVLQVKGENIIELVVPHDTGQLLAWEEGRCRYQRKLVERLRHMKEGGVAGLPNIRGVGPAQRVLGLVGEYRKEHPGARWLELYEKIPNHYAGVASMRGAMRILEKRCLQREKS